MNDTSKDRFTQLNTWYQKPLGIALAKKIKELLDSQLSDLFGYFLLQLGIDEQQQWLEKSPIQHKITVNNDFQGKTSAIAHCGALPFTNESIDVVFLPHTLEVSAYPDIVLAEAERVMTPDGHLLIVGFNPFSSWGVCRAFTSASWANHFSSVWRLKRMLARFDFIIVSSQDVFYRPPIGNEVLLNKIIFLEALGSMVWLYPGACYVLLAKKRVDSPQLIKPISRVKEYIRYPSKRALN
ncbi:MAG: methyltransferase domain-containing protein [Gammaproteobacteria bacterium]